MQDTRHPEYNKWLAVWERIRDGIAGQDAIKAKPETYLPKLGGQKKPDYDAYLKRARYINFPKRVLNIALGQLFRKNPIINGIDQEHLDNINLAGRDFNYFSRMIAREIITTNRIGILVDYSTDQNRPYLTAYKAENIINWQTAVIGGVTKLCRVVLEGEIEQQKESDKYQTETVKVWKELVLEYAVDEGGNTSSTNPIYRTYDWRKVTTGTGAQQFMKVDESTPVIDGKTFDYIPFYFCTSDGIVTEISESAMIDLVDINLGHYINSADYENMLHWTGARTVVVIGWPDDKDFPIGGCAALREGGSANFLEASSDSALQEGMKHKEEQMAVIASSFITGKGRYVASAETATKTSQSEYATLADISNALTICMDAIMTLFNTWAGAGKEVEIKYNTDFEETVLNPQDATAWSGLVNSKLMSWKSFFYNMKLKNAYPQGWTSDEEEAEIAKDQETKVAERDKEIEQLFKLKKITGGDDAGTADDEEEDSGQ